MTFAAVLRLALQRRGYTQARLAREIGVSPRAIGAWLRSESAPTLDNARRTSEILHYDFSAAMFRTLTRVCETCGATFLAHGKRRAACSNNCATVRRARRARATRLRFDRVVGNRVRMYAGAVMAFCRWHEPEGICRDAECPLRSVSPLPLIALTRRNAA